MTITLPPALQAQVDERLKSGQYEDAEDVLAQALQLLLREEARAWLRAAVQEGIEQMERGEWIPYTPGLMQELADEATRRFEAGESPSPDVLP